ncbi:MAG: HlyD family efflux transporter periplasmic adaptor subunit [Scytolyngbya sp. HA4215-MV1]|jgi:HlyD family secretion protein|nr:HlyD family efflux transporter periplasmic adaptor subunit [Scytolyngbya sp. HA4215-MV1]
MTQSLSDSQKPAPELDKSQSAEHRSPLRILIPLAVLVVGVGIGMAYFLSRPRTDDVLNLSGRLEGYPTDVGAKVAGRVNFVSVREGDKVSKGTVIVRLDDSEIQAQLQGATARLVAAKQQEQQALFQIGVVASQIRESQLNVQQSIGDAQGKIYQADANVAAAEAQLGQAQALLNQSKAELRLAAVNRDRFAQLLQEGAVTQQQYDEAQTTLDTAQATVGSRLAAITAAKRQVNASQGALVQAQTTEFNPGIRSTQLSALRGQLNVARSQLMAAQAEVKNAQAARQQIESQLAYLNVVSPINGIVLTRSVEPGQVVTSGKTLLTVINPNEIYLRGFVPEGEIGKIRVGQPARVLLDSFPNKPLNAQVGAIDTQASFTPENIYFREDRVKQVFGIRIRILDPAGYAKPGMPADGEILLDQQEQHK